MDRAHGSMALGAFHELGAPNSNSGTWLEVFESAPGQRTALRVVRFTVETGPFIS